MNGRSLLVYHPDGSTSLHELSKPVNRIGRSDDNDIVLPDPSRKISRAQAQLVCQGELAVVLRDMGSANGTFVNDVFLSEPLALRPDDVIRIGQYRIVYRDDTDNDSGDAETESPYHIEAASLELDELQKNGKLLDIADREQIGRDAASFKAFELVHEVGVRLARTAVASDVLDTAVDLLFNIEGVHRAALALWDEKIQAFHGTILYTRGGEKIQFSETTSFDPRDLVLSKTILRKVLKENRPLHIRDAKSERGLEGSMSIIRAGIQAAFCSPLTHHGKLLGILYADNLATPDAFSPTDFRIFATIAAQTGLALSSAFSRSELLKREVEQAALRLYLPPQVADLVTASGGCLELGGVLQQVTVLFADIRGFTPFSEDLDAPGVVLLLNEFFTAMTSVIFEAGGTLDKYIGDCVMALFGAPVPAEDDLDRGVRAAVNMQREVARMNQARRAKGLQEIKIGVGLHAGQAVVGNIGSQQRMQYTAIGDTVNVASRLVNKAAPGQIIVSESIQQAVRNLRNQDIFDPLGEVDLKGRKGKVNIYSVSWQTLDQAPNTQIDVK